MTRPNLTSAWPRALALVSLVTGAGCDQPLFTGVPSIHSPDPGSCAPDAAATSLTVAVTAGQVTLGWTNSATDDDGFKVQRQDNGGGFVLWDTVHQAHATSYVDSRSLVPDSVYVYTVTLTRGACDSVASNQATAYTLPPAPGAVTAVAVGPDSIELTWTDSSAHEATYQVARSAFGGAYGVVTATLPPNTVGYADTGLAPNTHYGYRVATVTPDGDLSPYGTTDGWTRASPPGSVQATAKTVSSVTLGWVDTNGGGVAYAVRHRHAGTSNAFTADATTAAGATSATVGALDPGQGYEFVVAASNAGGESAAPAVDATTRLPPALGWTGSATVDDACVLSSPGDASFDARYGATYASASGTLDRTSSGLSAGATGVSVTLGDMTPGGVELSWTVTDDFGSASTLTRGLALGFAGATPGLTAVDLPSATLGDDAAPGRQIWFASKGPAVQDPPSPGGASACSGCSGTRGSISSSCAVTAAGGARCWSPSRALSGLCSGAPCVPRTDVVAVAGNGANCALLSSGHVVCWGMGTNGVFGNGRSFDQLGPEAAADVCLTTDGSQPSGCPGGTPLADAVSLALGVNTACVVTSSGGVRCWGNNQYGQIGAGIAGPGVVSTATTVCASGSGGGCVPLTGVVAVSVGGDTACALLSTGAVKCWGANYGGALGHGVFAGTLAASSNPVDVCGTRNGSGCTSTFTGGLAIASVGTQTCVLKVGGTVACWGDLFGGYSASPDSASSYLGPVDLCGSGQGGTCVLLDHVLAVAPGFSQACFLLDDGTVRCWGAGTFGFAPNTLEPLCAPAAGSYSGSCTPLGGFIALAAGEPVCGLRDTGEVLCWRSDSGGYTAAVDPWPVCASGGSPGCSEATSYHDWAWRGCGHVEATDL